MTKRIKRLLVPLGTLTTAASVTAAISCGNTSASSNESVLLKNKTFVSLENGKYTETPFSQDATGNTGSRIRSMDYNLNNENFLNVNILSNPQYNVTDTASKLLKAGKWALQLGYASAIVLTVNGQDKVYDKDTFDDLSTVSNDKAVNGYVKLTSSDSSSINNPQFETDLKSATDLKIRIRKDMKWVDDQGNVVKNANGQDFVITAADFMAGWQKTLAFGNSSISDSYGATKGMNAAINASNGGATIDAFSGNLSVDNKYVYRLYGVEPDNFSDASKFISKDSEGNEYLRFDPSTTSTKPDYTLLLQQLSSSYDFVPLPLEWIAYENETKGDSVLQAITETALPKMKEEYNKLDKSSLAYKLGLYWYGYNADVTLSSGPYYCLPFDGPNNMQRYRLNTHYHNTDYVNSPTTIREFQDKYQQSAQSVSEFSNALYNGLKTGVYSQGAWSGLSDEQKLHIKNDPKQFYISYNSVYVDNQQTENIFFNINPLNLLNDSAKYESDAYTLLMYGAKQDAILNQTAVNPTKAATSTQALEFRTLLESAINWGSYVNHLRAAYGIASIPWINLYAFNVDVNGKDSTKATTPRENYYKINRTFVVGSDGNKVTFDKLDHADWNDQGKYLGVFDSSSIEAGATAGNFLHSIVYEQLQTQMTKLLDDFYAKHTDLNPSQDSGKMIVQIPTSYQYTQTYIDMLNSIAETWNGLDTKGRLEFKVVLLGQKDKSTWTKSIYNSTNPWTYQSWSYDYKEINSAFDGLQLYGFDYIYFNSIVDPTYKAELAKSFPVLAQIGDLLKTYMTEHNVVLRIRKDNDYSKDAPKDDSGWTKSTNGDYTAVLKALLALPQKDQSDAADELVEGGGLGLLTSQFWKTISDSLTQEELIELMNETTMILTPFPAVIFGSNSFAITQGKATSPDQMNPQPGKPRGTVVYNTTITPALYLQGYSIPYSFNSSWGQGFASNLRLLPEKK